MKNTKRYSNGKVIFYMQYNNNIEEIPAFASETPEYIESEDDAIINIFGTMKQVSKGDYLVKDIKGTYLVKEKYFNSFCKISFGKEMTDEIIDAMFED